jgi:membrane protease YdiL (CAAX protease family)
VQVSQLSHFLGDLNRGAPRDFRLDRLRSNIKNEKTNLELKFSLATLIYVQFEEKIADDEFEPLTIADAEAIVDHNPTPNDPPWTSFSALAVWIASVLFILIVPTVFLLPYLALHDPPLSDPQLLVEFARTDKMAIVLQIAAIIPAHLLTILVAWVVVTKGRRFAFLKMLGWEKGGFVWWHYVIILVGFFALAAVVGSFFPEKENDLIRILQSSRSAVYIVAVVATITAPFVEEVVYRGVLYSAFQRTLGIPMAFLLVTGLFALVHVPQYYPSFSTIFLLTVLSLTLTAIRVKANNLLPCVILHTLFNGIQSIFLILRPEDLPAILPERAAAIFTLLK